MPVGLRSSSAFEFLVVHRSLQILLSTKFLGKTLPLRYYHLSSGLRYPSLSLSLGLSPLSFSFSSLLIILSYCAT